MRPLKVLGHIGIVAITLLLILGIPLLTHLDILGARSEADAVSGASIPLPDQPSGDFVVLINTSLHKDTTKDWVSFFNDDEFVVIFEDISCLTAEGDAAGLELAQRYQLQLPENQMKLKSEDPTLLASKAEAGLIDVAVLSGEMADALELFADSGSDEIEIIRISDAGTS